MKMPTICVGWNSWLRKVVSLLLLLKKVGGFSYKVGDYTFGNKGSGQWQIVDKKGNEVDYLFGKNLVILLL